MNINFYKGDKPINVMIFRNDFEDRTYYKFGISKRLSDGTYENGYMDCQFRKETELDNKTKIHPKEAWLSFYINKDNRTIPYVFINEFEIIDDVYEEVYMDDILPDEEESVDIDNILD